MSTITKERLEQLANFRGAPVTRQEEQELARIAMASLEAEAVCVIDQSNLDYLKSGSDADVWPASRTEMGDVLLYRTAPPAPVSVPEWTNEQCLEFLSMAFRHAEIKGDLELDDIRLGVKIANGSSAAMLQGVYGKPELTVWYGSMPETNGKTNWTAMLHRKGQHPWEGITIECSEYPDRVRYEADRMRHLIGELSEEPDILEYDADAHSGYVKPGNSPVIPDGWVACSERLPESKPGSYEYLVFESLNNGVHHDYWNVPDAGDDCQFTPFWNHYDRYVTHWMPLPAAPQQEAKK